MTTMMITDALACSMISHLARRDSGEIPSEGLKVIAILNDRKR